MPIHSSGTFDGGGQTFGDLIDLNGLHDVVIKNYVLPGGISLANCQRVTIRNCTFTAKCIVVGNGVVDCDVRDCTFTGLVDFTAVYGWNINPVRLRVLRCTFDTLGEGIHIAALNGPANQANPGDPHTPAYARANDCAFLYNTFRRIRRFAIELQGDFHGLEVGWCWADEWVPADSRIAFSIATGGSGQYDDFAWDVYVHDLAIGGTGLRDGSGTPDIYYSALEIMGQNARVEDVTAYGAWGPVILYGWTSAAWAAKNIAGVGCRGFKGDLIVPEDHGAKGTFANVRMLADGAMPMPAPYPVPLATDGTAGPVVTPSVEPKPMLTVTANAPGTLTLSGLTGVAGTLWRKSLKGTDAFAQVATIAAGATSYPDGGPDPVSGSRMLSPRWEYAYQFRGADGSTASGNGQVSGDALPPTPAPAATVTVTVTATPTLTSTVNLRSADGGKTWGIDQQQP